MLLEAEQIDIDKRRRDGDEDESVNLSDMISSDQLVESTVGGDSTKDEGKYQKLIAAEEDNDYDLENLNTR